jgi:hypothetical protein
VEVVLAVIDADVATDAFEARDCADAAAATARRETTEAFILNMGLGGGRLLILVIGKCKGRTMKYVFNECNCIGDTKRSVVKECLGGKERERKEL